MIAKLSIAMSCLVLLTSFSSEAFAKKRYGETLCHEAGYHCYKVKKGDTWDKLFPDLTQQDIVRRVNRINISIYPGMILAVPNNLQEATLFDVAPFELQIEPPGQKYIVVDLSKLAWAAYTPDGNMVLWGPVSGGQSWCSDVGRPCRTVTGNYKIERKGDYDCVSSVFPLPYGGAAMPFCMHYYRGFALHGSFDVPGYNDSHGCVRMFINDARWLNENFADYQTKVTVVAE